MGLNKMSSGIAIPFNDLSRIHKPLLQEFQKKIEELVESSSFVLGQEVSSFETELALAENCKYAIGVNSGTSAIELALRALNIGPGDEVITTAFTFVATCFAIIQTGARPVLIDIDPQTGLMDPNNIQSAITKFTRAVIFVTLHGRVESLEVIQAICKDNGLFFIVDAAQSHLGTNQGFPQSDYCDAATLSFYPGKNLGALGEAGAVLTNSEKITEKLLLMRDWGAAEKYNHTTWGGNYRLESLQAAFLRIKLRELSAWTQNRIEIADIYSMKINPNLLMSRVSHMGSHVYHIYALRVENRIEFCKFLDKENIQFAFHYPRAIHQQTNYQNSILKPFALPNAEWLANHTLSIPIFPKQKQDEIDKVVKVVNSAGEYI